MTAIRRRLASGALALTVLQLALLFTSPISACCTRNGWHVPVRVAADEVECCPAGAHPAGECPLHRPSDRASASRAASSRGDSAPAGSTCRMMCDAPHGPQFLLGTIGVLPAPDVTIVSLASSALPSAASFLTHARPSIPDAPPPKFL